MTIASDLGFVVGKEYEVVCVGSTMEELGIKVGDYVLFTRDDGSSYPAFEFNGEGFCANIDPSPSSPFPVRIIPKEKPKMKKEFTKEDLRIGMLATFRKGVSGFYSTEKIAWPDRNPPYSEQKHLFIDGSGCITTINSLNSDLTYKNNSNYDIMKVYALGELIWEREEKTEQQLQIEKLEATIKQAQEELKQLKEMK